MKRSRMRNRGICPLCLRTFALADAPYRCINSEHAEDDAQLAKQLGRGEAIRGAVFQPTRHRSLWARLLGLFKKKSTSAPCPECGVRSSQRVCPYCHSDLAPNAHRVDHLVIAVIGPRNGGKTTLIATMLDQFERNGYRLAVDIRPQGIDTRVNFENHYAFINRDGRMPPSTQVNGDNLVTKQPLLYRFESRSDSEAGRDKGGSRCVNVVIFDAAGEGLDDPHTMALHTRGLLESDGIIFVVDSVALRGVRARLPTGHRASADLVRVGPEAILNNLIELFESRGLVSHNAKIERPVAFAFSKLDELASVPELLPDLNPMSLLPSPHNGKFNTQAVDYVSSQIERKLADGQWGTEALLNKTKKFANAKFFLFSSLGVHPKDGEMVVDVSSPVRVEDPLLWLLWRLGYLKTE